MELKLNIYEGKEIIKTYTSKDFNLRTGTCEDILKLVDIDKFVGGLNDKGALLEIAKVVVKSFSQFKNLMQEIFEGLTDEEYSKTIVVDIASVVLDVITYTITELFSASSQKN